LAKNPIIPKLTLDDDLLKDLKEGGVRESNGRPTNASPVNNKDPGNIQDGTNTGEGFLKGIGFKPQPNPMGDVFQPSYHFSFFLDGELPSERGPGTEFVIAETGLTGMNIQEVNIDAVVGPNIRTKNAMTTNVTIRIYEPYGAQLPDLLYQAAVSKGIRNYLKAPWFLKLKLRGYDEEGNVVQIGAGWDWSLTLIDVASTISENGSMHTITAMPISEQALNDQYCMLAQPSQATGTTVGEVLQSVIKGMNESVKYRYGASSKPLVEFAVEQLPYPYDTKVGVSNPFDHPITNSTPTVGNQTTNKAYDSQTGHFSPGTDFPAIVDMTMARSETAVKMARISRELPPASGNDDENEVRDVVSILHRIDTKVEYLDYDYAAGDYSKKITYIIKPYASLRLLTSMGRAMKFDKEKTLNQNKANFAHQKAFLKKQYDYIFTGLNTEVERFDINVNFNWAVQVPMFQGQNTNTGTPAQVDLSKNVQTLQADLNNKNNEFNDAQKKLDDLNQEPSDPNTPPSAERTKAKEDAAARLAVLKKEREDISTVLGKKTDTLNAEMAKERAAQLARNPLPQIGRGEGEDLVHENAQKTQYQGAEQKGASYLPITIVQDSNNPGLRTSTGTANDNDPNKTVYGSLLNQLYGTIDGNLQSIELDIRGDPYWLGPGDKGLPFDAPSTDTCPNFMNGEHMFLFRFKLPLGYDAKTGTVAVTTGPQAGTDAGAKAGVGDQADSQKVGTLSNIFTGFYATTEVNHKFQEGRFTQTLKATRIPGWSYENIIEGRENPLNDSTIYNNSKGPDKPAITPGSNTGGGNMTGNNSTVKNSTISNGSVNERQLLALTLVEEAGGEGAKGMQAVGNVIANRARYGIRGNTVSQVITSPKQFSAWNAQGSIPRSLSRREGTPIYNQAYQIAGGILDGTSKDITGGATDYYAPAKVTPSWANVYTQTTVIGNHRFMKR